MARFTASTSSTDSLRSAPAAVWDAIHSHELVALHTPAVAGIDADGTRWRWRLHPISALGIEVVAIATVEMRYDEQSRTVKFTAAPQPEDTVTISGRYLVSPAGPGARLRADIDAELQLPLPRLAAPGVRKVIEHTLARSSAGFARALDAELRAAA